MDKRLFLLNCFRRTISIQPSIWFFRKYQPWIALNILLKLWLIWGSRSYCAILIKGSLLQTLSKWKNKVVETQKKSVYFKKKYHPCNRIATPRTQRKKIAFTVTPCKTNYDVWGYRIASNNRHTTSSIKLLSEMFRIFHFNYNVICFIKY